VRRHVRLLTVDMWGVAGATHDDGEDVNLDALPMVAEGVGKRDVFFSDELRGVTEVIDCAIVPFSYLNLLIEE
jgi:hypothetical protein